MLLFYALTNTHLVNVANTKNTYFPNDDADLYVADSIRISPTLIKSIEEDHLFRNIIRDPGIFTKSLSKKYQKIPKIRGVLNIMFNISQSYIKIRRLYKILDLNSYSHVFINRLADGEGELLPLIIKSHNKNIQISIVEEGAGMLYQTAESMQRHGYEYLEYIILEFLTGHRFSRKDLLKHTKTGYFYRPEKYNQSLPLATLKKLPNIDKTNPLIHQLLVNETKSLDISEYCARKYIYFTSAEVFSGDFTNPNKQVSAILEVIPSKQLIIKDHPQFKAGVDTGVYDVFKPDVFVDQRNYLLESIYARIDLDEKVLISPGSGAVLHQKYLFDKEPYVILTYKFTPSSGSNFFTDAVAQDLIAAYNDKSKILIPKSLEEMQEMIRKLEQV